MEVKPKTVNIYETATGEKPYVEWEQSIKDKMTLARIRSRIQRVKQGNLGDAKSVGKGVSELRLAFGSGYRIYFGSVGDEIVILLCGGDKSTQDKDITTAQEYWADYEWRQNGKS